MASYNELNALIDAYINRNGVQAITGQILNGVLKAMVEQLGRGYSIMGAAIPTTDPGTPDGPECYFASETGTYTDFDGLQVAPGELALLCYTPSDGWTKATIYEGFRQVGATIDGNVGTPSVGVSYANGVLSFDFHNMKGNPGQNGQDGAAAGFGTIGADITGGVGTPGVTVESSGPATAKNLQFHFTNLKGETGVTSCVVTVDNTTGNPSCAVSLVGQELHLDFSGLKGAQGDTGSSVDYPFTIVNNLTTNDATQALSAAMGVQLKAEVSQLEAKVDELDGQFNGGTISKNLTWTNGYIKKANGTIANSTASKFTQPFTLKKGEKVTVGTNNSNICIIGTTTAQSLSVGDAVTVLQTTENSGFETHTFIATEDITIVLCVKWDDYTLSFENTIPFVEKLEEQEARVDAVVEDVNELEKIVEGGTITKTLTWTDGYIKSADGTIASSTLSKFTQPFVLKKGEKVTVGTRNSNICIIGTTSAQSLAIGDTVTVLQTIGYPETFETHTLIAEEDMTIVLCVRWDDYTLSFEYSDSITNQLNSQQEAIEGLEKFYGGKLPLLYNAKKNSAFKCLFFSDIHADEENMGRISKLVNLYPELFDCVINGGDTVLDNIADSLAWYDNAVAGIPVDVLTAIGNHDGKNATEAAVYSAITAKVVSSVQSIVVDSGKNRYYKDYGAVRVVVLDALTLMYWDSDAVSWLDSVLSDAIANNKIVLCVSHAPFSLTDADYGYQNLNVFKVTEKNPFVSYVGTTNPNGLSLGWHLENSAMLSVKSFIDGGGVFAGWLTGHTHLDFFFTNPKDVETYGYQPLFSTESARSTYGLVDCDKSQKDMQDAMNYVVVDSDLGVLKIIRLGINKDLLLREKNVLVYDYNSHTVIGCY